MKKNKQKTATNTKNIALIIILLALFVSAYIVIQKLGLLEVLGRLNERNISYWLIFLIGILASFHCVGMCGGLVVTYTATDRSKKKKTSSHWQYNLGRFVSYTIIGGLLGGFGSFFSINPNFSGVVTIVAAAFMVLMGLSLLTNLKWLKKIKLRTPMFIARYLYKQNQSSKPKGPFVIGLLNGFMPCGPLQAMQLYALASGGLIQGAISMGLYALGTIPLMFGFGYFVSLLSKQKIKQIFKFSGIVVIILGLFMFNRGLTNFGYNLTNFIPQKQSSQTEFIIEGDIKEFQTVEMDLTYNGYEPNVLYVKKGVPVRWVINAKQISGCTDEIHMPDFGIEKELQPGENIIMFTPQEAGEIKFSCWMQMVWGKFIVTGDSVGASQSNIEVEEIESSDSSCSGGDGPYGCSKIKIN